MKKSTLIAGLAGGVALYILNFVFYGLSGLADGHMASCVEELSRKEDVLHLHLALGHLLFGLFMAHIYVKWARGVHSFFHGIQFGGLLGFVMGVANGFIWYATMDMMSVSGHVIEGVWQIVSIGITGGVISVISGIVNKD